jgi:hypothetical protein
MDRWINGWVVGWMDGWMDGLIILANEVKPMDRTERYIFFFKLNIHEFEQNKLRNLF